MVRVLGRRAKDQLVTLVVAVRVPPPPAPWLSCSNLPQDAEQALLRDGCNAVPATRVADALVSALQLALAQLGGVRYAVVDRHDPRHARDGRLETPYIEVYDAVWLPATVPHAAMAAAVEDAERLAGRRTNGPSTSHSATLAQADGASASVPSQKRRKPKSSPSSSSSSSLAIADTFSPLCGATRASVDVLRWTRQLRIRLMWRPPGGRGMPVQNLLRTTCATLTTVWVPLTAADVIGREATLTVTAAPARGRRRERTEEVLVEMSVAIRVQYP